MFKFYLDALAVGALTGLTSSAMLLNLVVTHGIYSTMSGKGSPLFEIDSRGYVTDLADQYMSLLIQRTGTGLVIGAAAGAVTALAVCSIFSEGKKCFNSVINSRVEKTETSSIKITN